MREERREAASAPQAPLPPAGRPLPAQIAALPGLIPSSSLGTLPALLSPRASAAGQGMASGVCNASTDAGSPIPGARAGRGAPCAGPAPPPPQLATCWLVLHARPAGAAEAGEHGRWPGTDGRLFSAGYLAPQSHAQVGEYSRALCSGAAGGEGCSEGECAGGRRRGEKADGRAHPAGGRPPRTENPARNFVLKIQSLRPPDPTRRGCPKPARRPPVSPGVCAAPNSSADLQQLAAQAPLHQQLAAAGNHSRERQERSARPAWWWGGGGGEPRAWDV
jgi:hypothetical protein